MEEKLQKHASMFFDVVQPCAENCFEKACFGLHSNASKKHKGLYHFWLECNFMVEKLPKIDIHSLWCSPTLWRKPFEIVRFGVDFITSKKYQIMYLNFLECNFMEEKLPQIGIHVLSCSPTFWRKRLRKSTFWTRLKCLKKHKGLYHIWLEYNFMNKVIFLKHK